MKEQTLYPIQERIADEPKGSIYYHVDFGEGIAMSGSKEECELARYYFTAGQGTAVEKISNTRFLFDKRDEVRMEIDLTQAVSILRRAHSEELKFFVRLKHGYILSMITNSHYENSTDYIEVCLLKEDGFITEDSDEFIIPYMSIALFADLVGDIKNCECLFGLGTLNSDKTYETMLVEVIKNYQDQE